MASRDSLDAEIFRNKPCVCNTGDFSVNQFDTKTPLQKRGSWSDICTSIGADPTRTKIDRRASTRRNTAIVRRASLDSPVPLIIMKVSTSELSTNRRMDLPAKQVETQINVNKAASNSSSVMSVSS